MAVRSDDNLSIGDYLKNKYDVQRKEDQMLAIDEIDSSIFSGLIFFINGYTTPSNDELRRLIRKNSGRNESAREQPHMTHFVCSQFNDQQIRKEMERTKPRHYKYVTEDWIVKSIEAGLKLPESDFLPHQLRHISTVGGAGGSSLFTTLRPTHPNNPAKPNPIAAKDIEITAQDHPQQFLQQFISRSRLHFIGSFRDRVVEVLNEIRDQHISAENDPESAVQPPWMLHSSDETSRDSAGRVVLHADMDSFFVSALTRDSPALRGLPVCIAHGAVTGNSEIASSNYAARAFGVKNGMWMDAARALCPSLIALPYDFSVLREVSMTVLRILFTLPGSPIVESCSCDDAFIELPEGSNGRLAAHYLREKVWNATRCPMSVGIGNNMLTARIATRSAKPPHGTGVFDLTTQEVIEKHLLELPVSELPGVGSRATQTLKENGCSTCGDLQSYSLQDLKSFCGPELGKRLHDFCRGIDARIPCFSPPSSMSLDINWGIRFTDMVAAHRFVRCMAEEIHRRMILTEAAQFCVVTLVIKWRPPSEPIEPTKHLGHGRCLEKSKTCPSHHPQAPCVESLYQRTLSLFKSLIQGERIPVSDLRGITLKIGELRWSTRGQNGSSTDLEGHRDSRGKNTVQSFLSFPKLSEESSLRHRTPDRASPGQKRKAREMKADDDGHEVLEFEDDEVVFIENPTFASNNAAPRLSKALSKGAQPSLHASFLAMQHQEIPIEILEEHIKAQKRAVSNASCKEGCSDKSPTRLARSGLNLSRSSPTTVPIQPPALPVEPHATIWIDRTDHTFYPSLLAHLRTRILYLRDIKPHCSPSDIDSARDQLCESGKTLINRGCLDKTLLFLKALRHSVSSVTVTNFTRKWTAMTREVEVDVQSQIVLKYGAPLALM